MSIIQSVALLGASGQGPSADLGDAIDQSLRFGGVSGQKLVGSSAIAVDDTYTLSFWYKHTHNTTRYRGSIFTNNGGDPYLSFNANNGNYSGIEVYNGSAYVLYPPNSVGSFRQLRDPSAWLHCVIAQVNSTSFTIYINNEQAYQTTSQQCDWTNFTLGGHLTSQHICDGMIAQLYHIDGTALTPSSFGKPNDDGVWVPQDYTGTYGTNGFHLKFDSSGYNGSGGIGADHSGNGNDFTASGFDEGDVLLYSEDLSSTSGFRAQNPPSLAFDGSTSTQAQANTVTGQNQTFTFAPSVDIAYTSLEVHVTSPFMDIAYNGTTFSSNSGWLTIDSNSGTLTSSTPITITANNNGSSAPVLSAVRINGSTIIVDNTDNDVDYLDTPTSNYATLNPVRPRNSNIAPQKANLQAFASSTADIWTMCSTQAIKHKAYMEVSIEDQHGGVNPSVGIVNGTLNMNQSTPYNKVGSYHYQSNGGGYHSGSYQGIVGQTWGTNGDVIGVIFDPDTGEFRTSVNGTVSSVLFTLSASELEEDWFFQIAQYHGSLCDLNYGQKDFIHTPPTGFTGLQTNNLPEPTIKNGKDYFEAILYSGNGSTQSITGLEFQPDLVWLKAINNALHNRLFDSIRGQSSLVTNDTSAEGTSTESSLTSFDSNGFSITQTAFESYNNTGTNYVAWCWKAGGTAVSNTDGDITSSVSANTDAGFSIVGYTSQGGNINIGHGLNSAPEFMIVKARDHSINWAVYHKDTGNTGLLFLNTSAAFTTSAGAWNNTTPTNQVFRVGGTSYTNGSGSEQGDYIAYCWHSVPGYSAFGSYTGNGDTSGNGPFIYTGFRPAFVMMKAAVGATGSWMILDSTRSPSNPSQAQLRADLTTGEVSNAAYDVDFLSNGFKPRYYYSNNNSSGVTYIYVAFAENPFGGENAPPATAR